MKITRFEPGDGTSYRVLLHRVTAEEAAELGGVLAGAVLFGFSSGVMRPLPVGVFQPSGYLDFDYYIEQMGDQHEWTRRAGYIVLGRLLGRVINPNDVQDVAREWQSNWDILLISLLKKA